MTPQPTIYGIPPDSNLLYLPFVFFLPEDVIMKCPHLRTLPRCMGKINRSKEKRKNFSVGRKQKG